MGLLSKLFNIGVKAEYSDASMHQSVNHSNESMNSNIQSSNYSGEDFMTIEDVFSIAGRGTAVTGRITSGEVHIGDMIRINGIKQSRIIGIEMFRKNLDYAKAGDNVGLLLEGISRNDVNRGDILSK